MKQYIITKNHKFDETKESLVGGKAIGLWKFSYLNVHIHIAHILRFHILLSCVLRILEKLT